MPSLTVYPDPHPESTSVDGRVAHGGTNLSWATIIAESGNTAVDTESDIWAMHFLAGTTTNLWNELTRGIFLFDTSPLTTDAIITEAILSLWGESKFDNLAASPDINIYLSAPASNTALAAGDFDSLGSTPFATAITYANFLTAAYNDFTLNGSGISNISLTGVSKFGSRNANYDVAGSLPPWVSGGTARLRIRYADVAGTTNDPKIVITYVEATAALTGTITTANEDDIRAGGKTIILTLTDDTWVASGATFNAQRQNIINGIDSAQSEATGWDAVVKAGLAVTDVARTSDTVVTITLPAFASYNITVSETVTATIPATALTAAEAIVASPTFSVSRDVISPLEIALRRNY